MTAERLSELGLNDRQRRAIDFVKTNGRIDNSEYQQLTEVTKKTASRHLSELVDLGLLAKVGTTGRGVHYVLSTGKGGRKGTNET